MRHAPFALEDHFVEGASLGLRRGADSSCRLAPWRALRALSQLWIIFAFRTIGFTSRLFFIKCLLEKLK